MCALHLFNTELQVLPEMFRDFKFSNSDCISSFKWSTSPILTEYIAFLGTPHTQISIGVKSGDLAGHAMVMSHKKEQTVFLVVYDFCLRY